MPGARLITAGKFRYQITFVANPSYRGDRVGLYSRELHARIRRCNVPESIVVYFNGERSRTEEINLDYGFRSLSFKLRTAGNDTVTYCKEFPYFGFCIEYPNSVRTVVPAPALTPTGEIAIIAGLPCRKAEYQGGPHLFVWYTEEISVNDPTGGVFMLEGVPGLITQTEEIALSDTIDSVKRRTLVEMDFDSLPSTQVFSPPDHYRELPSIDAARLQNRRLLEENLRQELADPEEVLKFEGSWLFDNANDKIMLEISRKGKNEFRFRKTVLTAPHDIAGRVSAENALLIGRTMIVEEPPNYRLYRLENNGQKLTLVGNDLFTFTRRELG